jgi:Surface antigen variable number repeat
MTGGVCQNGAIVGVFVSLVMTLDLLIPAPSLAEENSRGLVVGEIEIVRNSIFSQSEIDSTVGSLSFLRGTMNKLHVNTREYVIRKELLFAEGEVFRPGLLDETERNLRELGFLNQIKISAIDTTSAGKVNIRVEVRDSWSLKTNLTYSRSASGDTRWNVSLSEVNFLGQALTMGVGLGADENSSFHSVWFRKRRLTKAGLEVGVDYSQRQDGHFRNIFISRPFYALGDKWNLETRAWDSLGNARFYLSNAGEAGEDPKRNASLYALLPKHQKSFEISSLMRLSPADEGRVWRLGAGVQILDHIFDADGQSSWVLSDGRETDLTFLTEPGQPFAREQGTTVFPFLWLRTQGRSWKKTSYVLQYGPTEDIPMDLSLSLKIGPTGAEMGSTTGFGGASWRGEAIVSKWMNLATGLFLVQGFGEWKSGSSENSFHRFNVHSGWLASHGAERSPWLTRLVAEVGHGRNLIGDRAYLLGLNRGLRTLDFDGMAGDRLVRWNVEQGKVTPWEVLGMAHLGFAAFYSGGVAWWDDEDRGLQDSRHEVGVGVRLGPTRSANALTSKLDISWALDGSRGPVFTAATRGFF